MRSLHTYQLGKIRKVEDAKDYWESLEWGFLGTACQDRAMEPPEKTNLAYICPVT